MSPDRDIPDVEYGILPSAYMRRARPELYSDSGGQPAYKLDAAALEQQLNTLTARNQTHDFEIFCRKLCERTICPNLKPATGPEGGGDSKADTETIAVADEIAILGYVGEPNAARERWAFAFSAKKTWKAKARADIDGLAATGRGYAKVFFITSQYARAKDRAELEDALSSRHGFRVEILDRSWIVSQVLEGGHQDLAGEYLGVGEKVTSRRMGPNDFSRTQRLEDLESAIQAPQAYAGMDAQRVSDALSAAVLSRELERPRFETEGRFERAIRLADVNGGFRQRLEARYQRLWTAFYWFDDIDLLDREYDGFAALALPSDSARNLEMVSNLLQNLINAVMHGHRDADALQLPSRTEALVARLTVLADETERPNNALEAATTLLLIEANNVMLARDYPQLAGLWPRFGAILVKAEGLAEYSADRLVQLIGIMGRPAGRDPDYSRLVDQLADFVGRRTGEGESGRILLKRAEQLDTDEDRFELVRLLGKATRQLAKKEYADNLVEATYMLAVAYKGLGMLWAARASAMFAVASIVADSDNPYDLPASLVPALMLLGWIDLELRLLPEFLDTIRLIRGARNVLPLDEASQARVDDRLEQFDMVLACQVLNFSEAELGAVGFLPDLLGGLALGQAQGALLYALGYEDIVLGDGSDGDRADLFDMYTRLASQPAGDLAGRALISNGTGAQRIETRVLGMTVAVQFEGTDSGHLVAQTLLAAVDTLFATTLAARVGAHVELFTVVIEEQDTLAAADYDIDQVRMSARLRWPRGVSPASPTIADSSRDVMTLLPALIFTTTCVVKQPLEMIEQLYRDESLAERIGTAVASASSRSRAFSADASRLSEWRAMSTTDYAVMPERRKIEACRLYQTDDKGSPGAEDAPPRLKDHRALEVRSILNFPLWEKAGWDSLLLGVYEPGLPPIIGLHFEDRDIGREIFADWRERFGQRDTRGDIHLAILRDLPGHPASHYAALLTAGVDDDEARRGQITTLTSRLKILEPETDINLRRFLEAYEQVGSYWLAPAAGSVSDPEIMTDLAILKRGLPVKRVCDVTDHDIEIIGRKLLMSSPG